METMKETMNEMIQKELRKLDQEQRRRRVLYFPAWFIGMLLLLGILYLLTERHCELDFPLFILLIILALVLMLITMYKNRTLCERIARMREGSREL